MPKHLAVGGLLLLAAGSVLLFVAQYRELSAPTQAEQEINQAVQEMNRKKEEMRQGIQQQN